MALAVINCVVSCCRESETFCCCLRDRKFSRHNNERNSVICVLVAEISFGDVHRICVDFNSRHTYISNCFNIIRCIRSASRKNACDLITANTLYGSVIIYCCGITGNRYSDIKYITLPYCIECIVNRIKCSCGNRFAFSIISCCCAWRFCPALECVIGLCSCNGGCCCYSISSEFICNYLSAAWSAVCEISNLGSSFYFLIIFGYQCNRVVCNVVCFDGECAVGITNNIVCITYNLPSFKDPSLFNRRSF